LAYLFIVVSLFLLAVIDLWVGVSNDAVNFIGSAVGCRAAKLKHVLLVAAAGVFVGAAFVTELIKVVTSDTDVDIMELLNTDKALVMIISIFLSVAVAFIFGLIVQWLSRLLFTSFLFPQLMLHLWLQWVLPWPTVHGAVKVSCIE
jgi:phosphate/sulfate permease